MKPEKNCEICDYFVEFIALIDAGTPVDEAFHIVVGELLDETIEYSYNTGIQRGHAVAYENLSTILGTLAEAINKEVDEELYEDN